MKHMPVPITFLVVVAATIGLIIFFGAWAVSVDAEEHDRAFSFAFPGSGSNLDITPLSPSRATQETQQRAPWELESSESKADTWWGKAFLTACPLH